MSPKAGGLWVVHRALPQGRILLGPDGAPLRRVDVLAANGVIHMLEGILLPPTILPILPKHCSEEKHEMVAVSTCHMVPAFRGAQRCLLSSSGRAGCQRAALGLGPGRDPTHPPAPRQLPGLSGPVDQSFQRTPASSGPLAPPSATILIPHTKLFPTAGPLPWLPSALALLSLTLSYLRAWLLPLS